MSEKNETMYDEDDSVKFIQNYLPQKLKNRFTDDDIIYILDLVDDFYEANDIDPMEEDEVEEEKMIAHIIVNAKKDGVGEFTPEEIAWVLNGEVAYCETIYPDEEKDIE
ncbi:MAG: hypothetical protein LBH04_06125 [Tannerellaceae bacterium]|jgi:hypothetical protein|nr:hypothetical protein [Tannerellaceae bacterium]